MADITYILKSPIQSTKSVSQNKNNNVYTFKVQRSSNKFQIKFIIETLFNVKVEKVNISRKKPFSKNRRVKTSLEKKAFIKLKEGYKIDDFEKIGEIMKKFAREDQTDNSFDKVSIEGNFESSIKENNIDVSNDDVEKNESLEEEA